MSVENFIYHMDRKRICMTELDNLLLSSSCGERGFTWLSHFVRMSPSRLPRRLFTGVHLEEQEEDGGDNRKWDEEIPLFGILREAAKQLVVPRKDRLGTRKALRGNSRQG